MNRHWWLLAVIGLGWSGVSPAEVYRCDQDGKLQYSDKPCVAGQVPVVVQQPNSLHADPGDKALAKQHDRDAAVARKARAAAQAESDKAYAARKKSEKQIREGQVRGEVVVGMTTSQVGTILGEPTSVRQSQSQKGSSESWTFKNGAESQTVTFKDGKVTSISRRHGSTKIKHKKK